MRRVLLAMGFHDRGIRRGAISYASQAGWSLDSSTSVSSVIPANRAWDGVIAVPTPYAPELNEYLAGLDSKTPMVWIDPLDASPDLVSAHTDHRAMGHIAAEYLIEQGLRHVAFCGGLVEYHDSAERELGVRETCEIMGIPFYRIDRCQLGDNPVDHVMLESIRALPKPVGICVVNDRVADILIRSVMRLGLDIPEEVSIIGAENDMDLCELGHVGITSVDGNTFHHAEIVCQILDHWMQSGEPPESGHLVLPPGEVIERESTGFPRYDNPEIQKALMLIHQDFADPELNPNVIIEKLSCGKSAAYALFQRECGLSISKFITKRRLRSARLLLATTHLPLRKIAKESGFSGPRQLVDAFKRELDMTPTEYREKRAPVLMAASL